MTDKTILQRMKNLCCKLFGHKRTGWKIEVKNGLVVSITWMCGRCDTEEKALVDNSNRLDFAIGLATMGLDTKQR